MNKKTRRHENLPRLVASITLTIPRLTLSTGWAYLRMRQRARAVSKDFMRGMVDNGIPVELAQQLRDEYANQVSLRTILRSLSLDRGLRR